MIPGDPIAAIRAFLLADPDVSGLVGARGYGGELPPSSVAGMPLYTLLVRPAGGGLMGAGDYGLSTDTRVDLFCYGPTPRDGLYLWRAVRHAMRRMHRTLQTDVLLHWAKESGGPNTLREQDTEWPLTLSSWQVFWSEMKETA